MNVELWLRQASVGKADGDYSGRTTYDGLEMVLVFKKMDCRNRQVFKTELSVKIHP